MADDPRHHPVRIDVDRERSLTLEWDDGRVSTYDIERLRMSCPCAECRGRRDKGEAAWPSPSSPRPLRIEDASTVGQWGLNLVWNDGHGTGIYTWDALRAWAGPPAGDAL